MATVFLKSDTEPTSELASIEKKLAYFLSVYSPTTTFDTTFNPGDDVLNITNAGRKAGAAGYHILFNGVPTALVFPNQVGGLWGQYRAAVHKTVVIGGKIIKLPGLRTPERFTPGLITILCHELVEVLCDPDLKQFAPANTRGERWLIEPCDWVEKTYWTRTIDGDVCVFPNAAYWKAFTDESNKQGPYDILGLVPAPFQCVGHPQAWGLDSKGVMTKFV